MSAVYDECEFPVRRSDGSTRQVRRFVECGICHALVIDDDLTIGQHDEWHDLQLSNTD